MYLIKRYPVQNPVLKNYIKFFWAIHADNMQLNNKLVPQRNINLKFNLSSTPHYYCSNNQIKQLEEVYFSGLHDQFPNSTIQFEGKVDMLGICFFPKGFYPFLKIPVGEFKNQMLGASEIGFTLADTICYRLKETDNISLRLSILEDELTTLLLKNNADDPNFSKLFVALSQCTSPNKISEICTSGGMGIRSMERLFYKHVGISAKAFSTLNRFQNGMNQLLQNNYSLLSDIAFDNGYCDQMHFIKEFKHFTGNTPRNFIKQNNSMLQVGKLS